MKKPEDYGSIMGINEEQYNALIEKIKLVQEETWKEANDYYFDSIEKMNAKWNKQEY